MTMNPRGDNRQRRDMTPSDGISEEVLQIKRVSKKTTGGNYISFTALIAVGDREGRVGVALGKGLEVPQAIRKGIKYARKEMITVPVNEETLPHDINMKYKSARLILKPAPKGTGLKVGSVLRTILALGGIKNASGKILGSRNHLTNAYAAIKALESLTPRK
ncbi:30S ribosomal protein S5 [bacterium]|nr:30S ribosomal protein S5 [bacterium]